MRIRTADGGWRLFEVVPTNMLDDPDVEGLVFHLRDLTERYEQQRAFRFMFEYSPLPQIQSFPGAGLVANHAFARLTGYSREELLARRLRDLVHADDARRARSDARRSCSAGEPILDALAPVRPQGRLRVLRPGAGDRRARRHRFAVVLPRRLRGRDGRDRGDERVEGERGTVAGDHRQLARHHRGALPERALGSEQAVDAPPRLSERVTSSRAASTRSCIRTTRRSRRSRSAKCSPGRRSPKEPIELRLRAGDGTYWTFECVGQNLGADDVDGGVVVTARNVTERKRAERAHREAEERFRTAFEHSPLCVSARRPRRPHPRHQRRRRRRSCRARAKR